MKKIDLRSDTVTLPTIEMREAMAKADVGDDVYGEDPTVNRLQELAAEKLGKEAGLFVASGTMGNLVALLAHCNRGDEMIMGNLSHTFLFEAGGVSALGGIVTHVLPNLPDGTLDISAIRAAIKPDNVHMPITRLVSLENTSNRCGGAPLSIEYSKQIGELAHEKGMILHLDGARIFNATVALGVMAAELCAPADSVTFCLSKGLCAPVGSVLCGSKPFIRKALRIRKQLGGGMRQAGFIAAAGIVALESMVDRLAEDHQRANSLAQSLEGISGLYLYVKPAVMTNMVFVALDESISLNASQFAKQLADQGVLVGVTGARNFRLVTHYWINDEDVELTIRAFRNVVKGL